MCSIYEHQKNLSFISSNLLPFLSVSKVLLPEWNLGELHQFLFLNGQGHISDSEMSNGARLVGHVGILLIRYRVSAEELRDWCCKVKKKQCFFYHKLTNFVFISLKFERLKPLIQRACFRPQLISTHVYTVSNLKNISIDTARHLTLYLTST